ncbi:MAG: hypothetical protein MZV63_16890 [Marinilabiliales bacterium]|nr:hypothetical protein [Marinilabiliales bacterium]
MFPCASECARRTSCDATVFDEVVKVSKDRTLRIPSMSCMLLLFGPTLTTCHPVARLP